MLACLEGQTRPKITGFRGRHSAEEAAGAKGQGRTGSLRKVQEVYQDWRVWNVRLVSGSDLIHCGLLSGAAQQQAPSGSVETCQPEELRYVVRSSHLS